MTSPQHRKRTARQVEIGASTAAGVVGSGFGAAKLRDSYKEEYPRHFAHGLRRLEHAATRAGRTPEQVAHLVRVADKGKPGFRPLAAATALAATATGARRYQGVQSIRQRRHEAERNGTVSKGSSMTVSAFGVDHGSAISKAASTRAEDHRKANALLAGEAAAGGVTVAAGMHAQSQAMKSIARSHQARQAEAVGKPATAKMLHRVAAAHGRRSTRALVPAAAGLVAMHTLGHQEGKVRRRAMSKAFDPERRRHARSSVAAGAAAGGAVVAGASSAGLSRRAVQATRASKLENAEGAATHHQLAQDLHAMAQSKGKPKTTTNLSGAARLHRKALGHHVEGARLAHAARVAGRGARSSAVAAVGLGAAAAAIARHDRRGSGRSYGYR